MPVVHLFTRDGTFLKQITVDHVMPTIVVPEHIGRPEIEYHGPQIRLRKFHRQHTTQLLNEFPIYIEDASCG